MEMHTTIVVGAGASAEFGLPVGSQLQGEISDFLDIRYDDRNRLERGNSQIVELCRRQFQRDFNEYQRAAWLIRDGILLSDSIDNFMDKHVNNERVRWLGQMSIAKAIAVAERNSELFVSRENSYSQLDVQSVSGTWLVKLFKILQRRVRRSSIEHLFENVSFIVFNYDRCLEHFLHWAVRLSYGVSESEASEVVSKADILHPYGTIGDLPWMKSGNGPSVDFGENRLPLLEMKERIRTYTDQISDEGLASSIKHRMLIAEQLVFLGFSYLSQNMDLLTPKEGFNATRAIGTAFGVSEFNRREIEKDLKSRTTNSKTLNDVTLVNEECAAFMANFERAFI